MAGVKTHGLGRRGKRLLETEPESAPQKPSTKELLIEAAEWLFAQHGIDGISLREIAVAAGQANKNVVQYHFKDKAGLIVAILTDRAKRADLLRLERLQNLNPKDPLYARELLKVLWLPLMAIRGSDGSHTFCRFLLQLLLQPHSARHPLVRFDSARIGDERVKLSGLLGAVQQFGMLYTHLPKAVMVRRMLTLNMMFLAAVVEYDNAQRLDSNDPPQEFDADSIFDMCMAALAVPPSNSGAPSKNK